MLHLSEHLLYAREAAETVFSGRWTGALRPSRLRPVSTDCPASPARLWGQAQLHPDVMHCEVKKVTKNGMCV